MNPLLAWRPWLVATVAAVMFLTNLGGSRLWDEDEPKNARCGVEMHQRGEWVVPTFNDELRSHKPVLVYWAMRASYAVFGVSEFSARLPSALAGILIALMCYHLGRLLFDRTTGLLAGLLLTSALMFAVLMRASTPDGVLMISTTAALLAFVSGVAARRGGTFSGVGPDVAPLASFQLPMPHTIAMYLAMGIAVLAKGPIGVLLPLWAIALYGLFGEPVDPDKKTTQEGPAWRRFIAWFAASAAPTRWARGAWSIRIPLGLLLVAAVAAPWYVAVSLRTGGDWLTGFLGTHNVGRFAGVMEGHDGRPFYQGYYLITFLVGFFPASCFLPIAAAGGVAQRRALAAQARSYAFGLAVIGAWLSFFSLAATRLPNYVIPCYVGLALVTAAWLVSQVRRFETAGVTATVRSWLGLGLTSSVVVGVVLTIALGIVGGVLMGSSPLIGLIGLAPLAGGAIGLWYLSADRPKQAVQAFAGGALAFTFLGLTIVAPLASQFADGPEVAERIARLESNLGTKLRVATHRYTTPSLVWELDRHVPGLDVDETTELLADPSAIVVMTAEAYDSIKADLPPGAVELADQGRFLRRHKRVVVIGHRQMLAHMPDPTTMR